MNVRAEDLPVCSRPLIGLTLGDVAGIGPEVAVRAALDREVRRRIRPLLVGPAAAAIRALRELQVDARLFVAARFEEAAVMPFDPDGSDLVCWETGPQEAVEAPVGQVDARAGEAAYRALIAATDAALAGQIDAVVTAPLNKEALRLAGHAFPGHTEILADRCGVQAHAMMLHLPHGDPIRQANGLSVAHVTLHTSIASVPGRLSTTGIRSTIRLLAEFVRGLGVAVPRIGVCALNPHAGEHGLFGDEEARLIAPAVSAETEHPAGAVVVSGPIPADALVRRAIVGAEFDGIVAMYHDQGHIPFKLIGFDRAVNVTLGLPIVRTSPSHGTAFDIAGQGRANASGMRAAVLTAEKLILSHR